MLPKQFGRYFLVMLCLTALRCEPDSMIVLTLSNPESTVRIESYGSKTSCGNVSLAIPLSMSPKIQEGIQYQLEILRKSLALWDIPLPTGDRFNSNWEEVMEGFCSKLKTKINGPFHLDMWTTPLTVTDELVSLQVNAFYGLFNSAHPTANGICINFRPKTQEFIHDLSIFKPEAQNRIITELQKILEARDTTYSKGKQLKYTLEKGIPNHFGFQGNYIVFTFWDYTVGPHASGIQSVRIPYSPDDFVENIDHVQ